MKNQFDKRLSQLLRENNMAQKELAEKIGVSQAIVTYWVKGQRQPTAENIYEVAKALETSSDYLLGLAEY